MIDSPMLNAMLNAARAQALQEGIIETLGERFNETPAVLVTQSIQSVSDTKLLRRLFRSAASSPTLNEFQSQLDSVIRETT